MSDDLDPPTLDNEEPEPPTVPRPDLAPRKRGFAAMDATQVSAIAAKGGKRAHELGVAHRFTSEEATAAGRKGGVAKHRSRGRQSAA